jgi:hypothetical protein
MGSVHAGLTHVRCPSLVRERHGADASDRGRDRAVTTQLTTQEFTRVRTGSPKACLGFLRHFFASTPRGKIGSGSQTRAQRYAEKIQKILDNIRLRWNRPWKRSMRVIACDNGSYGLVRQYNSASADDSTEKARMGNHYAPRWKCGHDDSACGWFRIAPLEAFPLARHQPDSGYHRLRCQRHRLRPCVLLDSGLVLEQTGRTKNA